MYSVQNRTQCTCAVWTSSSQNIDLEIQLPVIIRIVHRIEMGSCLISDSYMLWVVSVTFSPFLINNLWEMLSVEYTWIFMIVEHCRPSLYLSIHVMYYVGWSVSVKFRSKRWSNRLSDMTRISGCGPPCKASMTEPTALIFLYGKMAVSYGLILLHRTWWQVQTQLLV